MKFTRYERDERLSFWRSFLYEFNMVFLVIFINGAGLVFLYNELIKHNAGSYITSVFILIYLFVGCLVSSVTVYVTRARIYSRNIQMICKAAQKVSRGDFSVRLDVFKEKSAKNEIDILKEDFNKMVSELASIEKLKDNFIADVSHEIKTPLSVIRGYADLLKTPGLGEKEREEYIDLLSGAINNLTTLVSNILKLNKIESQEIVQKEKYSLDEQIRYCILAFEDKINDKNIQLEVHLDEVEINSDKSLLELVWNNLISNALKFTPDGGKITLVLKEQGNIAIATVRDTGCGMSAQTQKHIFDKFYQGDTSHSGEGNGLGLALVDRVVKLLDGEIVVDSVPDEGSEFKIVLENI